ncbi:aspartate/glutamate racemase family protein [Mariniflexile ostreae]|uniref:Aspartate/glutamate racemase family protein n=1 Tax=Mariniflexile ostreae TaxID=1520892 RepID=A0ABV5FES7_9FLAO
MVIGILGLGSRSTLFYLEELNKKYHKERGGYHTFPCMVYNVDFHKINSHLPNQFETLLPELEQHLNACFKFDIDTCIIPNITLHETYDLGNFDYPIIHPISLALSALKHHKAQKVTIFGSKYTMESVYVKSKLEAMGVAVNAPALNDINTLDSLRQSLYKAEASESHLKLFKVLLERYCKTSTVLIACTELSIINSKLRSSARVLDLAQLQIENALQQSF